MLKFLLVVLVPLALAASVGVQVGSGGLNFSPQTVNIRVGDTVTWTWVAGGHNVVSGSSCIADGKFCSLDNTNCTGAPLSSIGTTYSFTFAATGTYNYFCRPHCNAGMNGTITVVSGASASTVSWVVMSLATLAALLLL